jgi:xanthine dehydrogenase accessory factor
MRDILIDLKYWLEEGKSIALATVIQTWGSSPRVAGSKMAITLDGKISGSVSGGCVENAVIEAGVQSLKTNQPQLLHFGVADETAWEVGLACGGSIDVFVKPLDKTFFTELNSVIAKDQPAVTVTVVRGPDGVLGREFLMLENDRFTGLYGNYLDRQILDLASEVLSQGASRRVTLEDELEVFFEAILPAPTLIVVGGVHISVAITSIARTLGYRTIVIDPRKAWGNVDRFPHVDRLSQEWPEDAFRQIEITRSTAIAMLTHDPKLDDPALKVALSSPAFYVGALGSKSTNEKRRERLLKDGLNESQLSRLHAPIGLDIGAQSPEEIALAIMAQVVEARRKREQAPAEVEADLHLSE